MQQEKSEQNPRVSNRFSDQQQLVLQRIAIERGITGPYAVGRVIRALVKEGVERSGRVWPEFPPANAVAVQV